MKEDIKKIIEKAAGFKTGDFSIEASNNPAHGDYSSNIAFAISKKIGKSPIETADLIKGKLNKNIFEKVEVAGPGFLNFWLKEEIFRKNIGEILKLKNKFGKNKELAGKKIIIDYTDPNPFKDFHIGHLMSNAIGESLSRIFEAQGAKVKRVCYQGDVGIHVAKAIWAKKNGGNLSWPAAYAFGSKMYEEDEPAKKEIAELNKKIYERNDKQINKLYDDGKKESLKYFDGIYKKLGTKFDWLIFESQVADLGKKTVEKGLKKGIFEKGEKGAVIFKGEKCGLHTRVFINSEGIPTYEAKDLGLAEIKYKKYPYDKSFIVTGNEVNEYFKVMLCAMGKILPKLAGKTKHIGHGMLRLPEGKMSSRTGNVVTGESLILRVKELVEEKVKERDLSQKEKDEISEKVAIGAIKYSILKQSIGSDIIYDFAKSISFEGDSGPYLQYSFTRAKSVLEKANREKIRPSLLNSEDIAALEKKLYHFDEVLQKSGREYEPHYIVLYLTELAGLFNNYYAKNRIVDRSDKNSPYRVALTKAFSIIMENGMELLGINFLEKM